MPSYALTWNPANFSYQELAEHARATASGEIVIQRWTTGTRKSFRIGDRIFLLRQRVEPRGIFASGQVVKLPVKAPHFDPQRASQGAMQRYVTVAFDVVLDPNTTPILSRDILRNGVLSRTPWHTAGGGFRIITPRELDQAWSAHLRELKRHPSSADDDNTEEGKLEGELRLMLAIHRSRERSLRDEKIRASLREKGELSCEVPSCGFNFFKIYGELGRDFAHVHHTKPLNLEQPRYTSLKDLAIVCPNCHAMIHRHGACRPLLGLIPSQQAPMR